MAEIDRKAEVAKMNAIWRRNLKTLSANLEKGETVMASKKSKRNAGRNTKEGKTFLELLPVRLSAQEKQSAGQELADVGKQVLDKEEEKTATTKQYTATIKALKKRQRDLIEQVNRSEEMREVTCEETLDFDNNIVRVVRLDTKEEIKTRLLTDEEKQLDFRLSVVDDAKKKSGKKSEKGAEAPAAQAQTSA